MHMLVFSSSVFPKIYLVATFILAFMLNSFSLLSTFNKKLTWLLLKTNLKPRTT